MRDYGANLGGAVSDIVCRNTQTTSQLADHLRVAVIVDLGSLAKEGRKEEEDGGLFYEQAPLCNSNRVRCIKSKHDARS